MNTEEQQKAHIRGLVAAIRTGAPSNLNKPVLTEKGMDGRYEQLAAQYAALTGSDRMTKKQVIDGLASGRFDL